VEIFETDMATPDFDARSFASDCVAILGQLSHVFIPLGAVDSRDCGLPPDSVLSTLTTVNYLRPAQVLTAFCEHFARLGEGTAMVFTSVAAHAPRGQNAAYAAAKTALEFYCRSLQHHFAESGVSIQVCALGYVDTSMSFGARLLFPAVDPIRVARFALRMSAKRRRFAYFPRFWSLIIMTLKAIPWPLYKRLRF
jgi:decaprenylphospho-beta-D-erythro-pentofuranosid-2-ulose 2-reductase